jgi:hypothetical protein
VKRAGIEKIGMTEISGPLPHADGDQTRQICDNSMSLFAQMPPSVLRVPRNSWFLPPLIPANLDFFNSMAVGLVADPYRRNSGFKSRNFL